MKTDQLVAIDIHVHAEVSCCQPVDPIWQTFEDAASKYFKVGKRPTIAETVAYYRERKIGLVMFTVDMEAETGAKRIPNQEVIDAARENSDMMMAFASVDPHKGKFGALEARRLIEEQGVSGFKFHPSLQNFQPNSSDYYPLYEVLQELRVPTIFHSGQTGIGANLPGGRGIKLALSDPLLLDEVAADFPELTIVLAHAGMPWYENALAMATHKSNVFIDLSGWSPKYFPAGLLRAANSYLRDKFLFGSDFPVITPERWLRDFEGLEIADDVRPLILKENAVRVLGL